MMPHFEQHRKRRTQLNLQAKQRAWEFLCGDNSISPLQHQRHHALPPFELNPIGCGERVNK
jgi:hypothetical protein